MSDKGFIWNPSNCGCECDKSCDIGEYLDYENCKCKKRIIDRLVEECRENIYKNEMLHNETLNAIPLNVYKKVCNSCTGYIVLFVIFLVKFHWYLKKDNIRTNFNVGYLSVSITAKQIDIKTRTYYFYNDLINIENFDPSMLNLDKKTVLNHDVYYVGYITKKHSGMLIL